MCQVHDHNALRTTRPVVEGTQSDAPLYYNGILPALSQAIPAFQPVVEFLIDTPFQLVITQPTIITVTETETHTITRTRTIATTPEETG